MSRDSLEENRTTAQVCAFPPPVRVGALGRTSNAPGRRGSVSERLFARVVKSTDPDGCWTWIGYVDKDGYGKIWVDYENRLAHDVSYELSVAPVPAGLELDHQCRNKACVRPDHLKAVTRAENLARRACSACGVQGHYKRTCKVPPLPTPIASFAIDTAASAVSPIGGAP